MCEFSDALSAFPHSIALMLGDCEDVTADSYGCSTNGLDVGTLYLS